MNVFELVKQNVTSRQAAELYGIHVSRNGMAICPFHNDKNPSMKLDRRFHCFGCQADGDVIDFTARLFSLKPKEAAQKLAEDFSIGFNVKGHTPPCEKPVKPKISEQLRFRQEEQHYFHILCTYRRLLEKWKTEYVPNQQDENRHPLFVEALQKQDYIDYLLNVLLSPDLNKQPSLPTEYGKEVRKIEQRISEFDTCHPAGHKYGFDR